MFDDREKKNKETKKVHKEINTNILDLYHE